MVNNYILPIHQVLPSGLQTQSFNFDIFNLDSRCRKNGEAVIRFICFASFYIIAKFSTDLNKLAAHITGSLLFFVFLGIFCVLECREFISYTKKRYYSCMQPILLLCVLVSPFQRAGDWNLQNKRVNFFVSFEYILFKKIFEKTTLKNKHVTKSTTENQRQFFCCLN